MGRLKYGLLVFVLSQVILSCSDSCGCKVQDPSPTPYFDINGMQVGFSDRLNYGPPSDTSITNFTITEDSAIANATNSYLVVLFQIAFIAQHHYPGFSLINSAYACSPVPPGNNGSKELIDSFYVLPIGRLGNDSVYTDTLFDFHHPDITYVHYNGNIVPLLFNSNIISGIGQNADGNYISSAKIYFQFNSEVMTFKTNDFIRFKVVLKLANGERYEKITNRIRLI